MTGAGESDVARIAVLPPALADQIAAGEVVERPASIVKELVENAIDAGATRVEVELSGGGRERIRVLDDGRGIHRDDLILAITRHATSKLRSPDQLIEIHTLGFRGEALASIAAVARVEIRSRRAGEAVGHLLTSLPGAGPTLEPIGMPAGTQIEVAQLFANVPARRKFLRAEATEVGHCVDAVVRAALVHPQVGFRVRHDGRELLDLRPGEQTERVVAILQRRGGVAPFHRFSGERDGVRVAAWLAAPQGLTRQRHGSFVVVRRRVVRERTLAATLKQAYGDRLADGLQPIACLFVDPPHGTVDVNVHPQKSEVRFAAAQQVYAAVRELLEQALTTAPWGEAGLPSEAAPGDDWAGVGAAGGVDRFVHGGTTTRGADARAALAGWSRREGLGGYPGAAERDVARGGASYRLGTRAAAGNYADERDRFRGEVDRLRATLDTDRALAERSQPDEVPPGPILALPEDAFATRSALVTTTSAAVESPGWGPRLLTCLAGPIAVFEHEGALLVADLRRARAHLVRRRLVRELSATDPDRRAPAQALLQPVVVARSVDARARLLAAADDLRQLGLELEGFGDDAVLVRAVPAALPRLLDAASVGALLDRLGPWLDIGGQSVDRAHFADAVAELGAALEGAEVHPRVARGWMLELLREHDGAPERHPDTGVRRWTPAGLVGQEEP